jgi:TonB family protein
MTSAAPPPDPASRRSHAPAPTPGDDGSVTLRVPRWLVALAVATLAHVVALVLIHRLPDPKKLPERIELSFATARPPPPAASPLSPPAPPKKPPRPRPAAPPPSTTTVRPELPPSDEPPPNRAQLPVAELSPTPAPPPQPSSWKDRLKAQLDDTGPRAPKEPTGVLAPSFANLQRVALADARMHDEENEQRMMEDFGVFFRRGLEALRRDWHPDEVLDRTERDPTRRCGHSTRTTFAVAVLDKTGNVVDVELKNPSGCPDLDDEAVAAFKRVAQFPHPPQGIFVSPEGEPTQTARYPVRFIVTFDGGLKIDWRG